MDWTKFRPFVAMPLYSPFGLHYLTAKAFYIPATSCPTKRLGTAVGSFLPNTFNQLLHSAIEDPDDLTHFCMIHGDIVPQDWWIDSLIQEMEETGCQVLSAVSPIKTHRHDDTSTAIGVMDGADSVWRRITLSEIRGLPPTFSIDDIPEVYPGQRLLVNTGLMCVDLRGGWCRKFAETVGFQFQHYSKLVEGKLRSIDLPEDWLFSWAAHDFGCKVMATSKVRLAHHGDIGYLNCFRDQEEIVAPEAVLHESHK